MKKNFKLGVIGAGFMSNAIISGILSSNVIENNKIICSDINSDSLKKIESKSITTTTDNNFLVENSEFVLFAVKPQSLQSVFDSIYSKEINKIITIVAGTRKEKFKKQFPNVKVARCMPNTPCSINSGAIGLDLSDYTNIDDINFIISALTPLGKVVNVEENKLDIVTGISGSSPAYFYLFVKSLVDSAKKQGLDEKNAKELVVNTMIGSGKMILKNEDKSIDELITAVCSKGGTTIEAMKSFENNNFSKIIDDAVVACINRAKELEKI